MTSLSYKTMYELFEQYISKSYSPHDNSIDTELNYIGEKNAINSTSTTFHPELIYEKLIESKEIPEIEKKKACRMFIFEFVARHILDSEKRNSSFYNQLIVFQCIVHDHDCLVDIKELNKKFQNLSTFKNVMNRLLVKKLVFCCSIGKIHNVNNNNDTVLYSDTCSSDSNSFTNQSQNVSYNNTTIKTTEMSTSQEREENKKGEHKKEENIESKTSRKILNNTMNLEIDNENDLKRTTSYQQNDSSNTTQKIEEVILAYYVDFKSLFYFCCEIIQQLKENIQPEVKISQMGICTNSKCRKVYDMRTVFPNNKNQFLCTNLECKKETDIYYEENESNMYYELISLPPNPKEDIKNKFFNQLWSSDYAENIVTYKELLPLIVIVNYLKENDEEIVNNESGLNPELVLRMKKIVELRQLNSIYNDNNLTSVP